MLGRRGNSACWVGRVLLLLVLAGLPLAAACGDGGLEAGERAGSDSDTPPTAGEGEAGGTDDPGGDADVEPPDDDDEAGGPGGPGGQDSLPPDDDDEAGDFGGPGGASTTTGPPDDDEAGDFGGPGGASTTSTPQFFGAENGHIWGPNCDVAVTELMEAGQFEELRSQLDACILSDPTAPADVVAAARNAKAQAP